MPKTGSHRVKPNNSTPNSTHAASVKAVITIFMLVLTFINPVLFIIPTALCVMRFQNQTPFNAMEAKRRNQNVAFGPNGFMNYHKMEKER